MATKSSIEWTESTWNPLTGCTKISPGCKLCYAERMSSAKGHGATQLPERFQVDFAQAHARYAPSLEEAPGGFR